MWTDLGVLAPSLVVAAAFLAGVFALLRREIAPRRRDRDDGGRPEDLSERGGISAGEDTGTAAGARRETQ